MPMKIAEDRRSEQGAWLFIASLAVFFFSCVFLYAIYVVIRASSPGGLVQPFILPVSFITTTVVLIAISICLHMAVGSIRRERRVEVWRYIIIASILVPRVLRTAIDRHGLDDSATAGDLRPR